MTSRQAFVIRCQVVARLRDEGRTVTEVAAIMLMTKDNVRRHAARANKLRAKA